MYDRITALLVEAVKDQQNQINILGKEVNYMKSMKSVDANSIDSFESVDIAPLKEVVEAITDQPKLAFKKKPMSAQQKRKNLVKRMRNKH